MYLLIQTTNIQYISTYNTIYTIYCTYIIIQYIYNIHIYIYVHNNIIIHLSIILGSHISNILTNAICIYIYVIEIVIVQIIMFLTLVWYLNFNNTDIF